MTFATKVWYNFRILGWGAPMVIKVTHLSAADVKHVGKRLRKLYPFLSDKDSTAGNVRAWLKYHFPHVRFSVQGAKTAKSALSVSWVNYSDNLTPSDSAVRSSLQHFSRWNRAGIELPKYGAHAPCCVETQFFTDLFGGAHIIECVQKAPSDVQRHKREALLAHKSHKTLSAAVETENHTQAPKRRI